MIKKIIKFSKLEELAKQVGLNVVGYTDTSPDHHAAAHLTSWQEKGYAAEMNYMIRPSSLLAYPLNLVPEAKSIVTLGVPYSYAPRPPRTEGYGKVARYAWGRDYHIVLKKRLREFVSLIKHNLNLEISWRGFSDAVPLLERAFAARSGLGFIGKNTMLIRPGSGSFFFIAEIIWDIEIEDPVKIISASIPLNNCKTCTRCIDNCPTNAFETPFVLNANKCISFLTIEKKGMLNIWERKAIGDWVFGCDICQDVCPFNYTPLKTQSVTPLKEFSSDYGCGPQISLSELLRIKTKDQFLARFAGTPLMRAGRESLLRNASFVAANTSAHFLVPDLVDAVMNDTSHIVRASALWSLIQFRNHEDGNSLTAINKVISDNIGNEEPSIQMIINEMNGEF